MTDLMIYEAHELEVKQARGNYLVGIPGGDKRELKRGTDFGFIKKKDGSNLTKTPTLFKSGAEKIAIAYGLCQNYEVVSKIEDSTNGLFFYLVRCDLVKFTGTEKVVITSAFGSANTREGRNGQQSCWDGANSCIKMAQKRALVSAAISLGCVSDMFTQDIESEESQDASALFKGKPTDKITSKQVTYFYTIATRNGITKSQAKEFLASKGVKSANDITNDKFDMLCEGLAKLGGNTNGSD